MAEAPQYDPILSKQFQKIDLYSDQRDAKRDTMDEWDQAKLEEVVRAKHGNEFRPTDIVCKFFLDALEKRQYGWFWTCPNGGDLCKYRHYLPPGYVLKEKQATNEGDEDAEIPLEEQIERERASLPAGGTPVTLESFKLWKEKKEAARLAGVESERIAAAKKSGGRGTDVLSGRDLFTYDPTLFIDDEDAADEEDYEEESEEDSGDGNDSESDEEEEEEEDETEPANGQPSASSKTAIAGLRKEELFLEEDVPDDLDI